MWRKIYMCMVCMCVWERNREREREVGGEGGGKGRACKPAPRHLLSTSCSIFLPSDIFRGQVWVKYKHSAAKSANVLSLSWHHHGDCVTIMRTVCVHKCTPLRRSGSSFWKRLHQMPPYTLPPLPPTSCEDGKMTECTYQRKLNLVRERGPGKNTVYESRLILPT